MSKKTARTGAQVAAADPGQSVWVSANAGTGKTHVLIERILRLLLAGTRPNRILCLTFTKAAAAEVATRLSTRLGHWAAYGDKALEEDLSALLGVAPGDSEKDRARSLFAQVLETPEGIRVRNLHSFAESILGRFPVEAGLSPHFSVIDERRAAELRTEARDRLLAGGSDGGNAGGNAGGNGVRAALRHLAGLVNQDQFAQVMGELDGKRGVLRRLIHAKGGDKGLRTAVRQALGLGPEETGDSVLTAAAENGAFDGPGLTRAAEALDQGAQTDKDRAQGIRLWLAMPPEDRAEALAAMYADLFLTKDRGPRKKITTKGTDEADPGAEEILRAEQDRMLATITRIKACAMAAATESLLVVGLALIEAYERMKHARAFLDYDDLIEKAHALLTRSGGVSWVHYKLDGGIDHILVDEAQDTSPDQWEIISGLAGEFFSGLGAGDDERPVARTVFAVGDEKQSIYSFQGADPERFGMMRQHFQSQAEAAGRSLPEVELAVSYRSTAAVLSAVDAVFADTSAADGLTWDGKPITHHSNRHGQGGLVELWPTLTPDEVPEIKPWDAPLDQLGQESPPVRLADKIAAKIERMWRDGDILESAARPVEPGDIMILVRTRGTFADIMVRALERRGIPVAGRDRLVLTDHLAVMDLVAAGRFALLPDDDLNTAVVLKGPFVEFDDDALFDLAFERQAPLWRTLAVNKDKSPLTARAHAVLAGLLATADVTPPYEFFARLLGPGGGRRDLIAHLGKEAGEPIDEFLSLALDFERGHEPSLEGFLHWLEVGEVEIKREMERGLNEVRVLTVHGAKGLESEIVFLPDTCSAQGAQLAPRLHWPESGNGADGGPETVIWRISGKDEEDVTAALHEKAKAEAGREQRRLLYVAMTRARDRLYISGWETKRGRAEGCWYDLMEPALHALGEEIDTPDGDTIWRLTAPQTGPPDASGAIAQGKEKGKGKTKTESPPDWAMALAPPEPEPTRPLTPSRPSEEEPSVISPLEADDGARFKRGILVHRLLQSLPDIGPGDREAAARAFLARPALGLEKDELEDLLAETLEVLSNPDHAGLFGPGSLAEVPITGTISGRDGEHVISGQLDRLWVTEDAVSVIDFKTNRPPPETPDKVQPQYLRQMAAYREALQGIYPGRPIRSYLLWTVGPTLMLLDDEILNANAP
ncbi:MAG: double-strand break repair helicase AddA [Rhodospirillales bacterium]|nr:double-strand break repair helicase AddA [Rhodospirillales bacterium]